MLPQPSITSAWPVMEDDRPETRNRIASAISSALAQRPHRDPGGHDLTRGIHAVGPDLGQRIADLDAGMIVQDIRKLKIKSRAGLFARFVEIIDARIR
jgi:hypothetical protein